MGRMLLQGHELLRLDARYQFCSHFLQGGAKTTMTTHDGWNKVPPMIDSLEHERNWSLCHSP
jgi:hypothetical protein